MPKSAGFLACVLILASVGCAAVDRRVDIDPAADFSRLKTYAWTADDQRADGPAIADPRVSALVRQRIRDAVDGTLTAKGYRQAAPANMLVTVTVGVHDRTWVTSFPVYGNAMPWRRRYGPLLIHDMTSVSTTTERTLAIDVFDAESRRPIWHGRVTTLADADSERPEAIAAAISRLLEPFPPRQAPSVGGAPFPPTVFLCPQMV